MELKKGVHLTIIPTTKFKTISFKIVFKTGLTKENITSRSLLSRLLERNSKQYPTQSKLQQALSNLYGASFGTSVARSGNVHTLSLNMRIVNDQFLAHDQLTKEAINFLKSVLFEPNIKEEAFDEKTFIREKINLKDDIESIYDNKQQYAKQAMLSEYFTDKKQSIPIDGDVTDLNSLSASDLYQTYNEMLLNDEIEIIVLGDVEEDEMYELFKSFSFDSRTAIKHDVFYENERTEFIRKEEVQEVQQAKLNLAYDTGIYYLSDDYFALQVFNGLFGGFPSSKLFMNVREKESLAYYASSRLDSTRAALYVQTGIDKKEADRVIDLINVQIKDVIADNFSDELVEQTKEMLKNGLRQSEDSPGQLINSAYSRKLVGKDISIDQWIEKINNVTREDIKSVAEKVVLRTIFLLKGE